MKIFGRDDFERKYLECTTPDELELGKISTGSKSLDQFLDNGIPVGFITHVYGSPASGKTNFCMSVAAKCASEGKKVLYIDTEGGFSPERFYQICKKREHGKNVLIKQPLDFVEQGKVVRNIQRLLNKDFKLLVIDSIVSLYRLEVTPERAKVLELSRELGRELAWLSRIARENEVAVLLSNQVYTSFNGENEVVPVGGDVLMYWSKVILEFGMHNKENHRTLKIIKHPSKPERLACTFRICGNGLV